MVKVGQEAIEAEAQVHLCRGLAAAMLRPVHAIGHQFHHRRVHRMNAHLEAVQQGSACITTGCSVDDVTRNELEPLPENIDVMTCWLSGVSVC